MAELRSRPGQWAIHLNDQPARLLRTIRERSAPALRPVDGVIEARLRQKYIDQMGRARGDIYLRFTPK